MASAAAAAASATEPSHWHPVVAEMIDFWQAVFSRARSECGDDDVEYSSAIDHLSGELNEISTQYIRSLRTPGGSLRAPRGLGLLTSLVDGSHPLFGFGHRSNLAVKQEADEDIEDQLMILLEASGYTSDAPTNVSSTPTTCPPDVDSGEGASNDDDDDGDDGECAEDDGLVVHKKIEDECIAKHRLVIGDEEVANTIVTWLDEGKSLEDTIVTWLDEGKSLEEAEDKEDGKTFDDKYDEMKQKIKKINDKIRSKKGTMSDCECLWCLPAAAQKRAMDAIWADINSGPPPKKIARK